MRIGVISDTHGLLRPEALAALAGVEHILHAGDIGAPDIVLRLEAIAPVTAIRGNVDRAPWTLAFPETATLALAGQRIHLVHAIDDLASEPAEFALVVFGHSHRPSAERRGETWLLNPGSAGPRRFRLPVTLAVLELTPEAVAEPRIVPLLA